MATTTKSETIKDFTGSFGEVAERYRVLNEKLIDTGKKTSSAALDGYQKALGSYLDFTQQLAGATQLEWVSTVVKARNDFLSEVNGAYISAVRDVLK